MAASLLFFAKRMQLPPSLVAEAAISVTDEINAAWSMICHSNPAEIEFARGLYVKCESRIIAGHVLFVAGIHQVLASAPLAVKRYCKIVFMLLRYRLFPGQRDVCWLIMERLFMRGDSVEAGVAIINQHPRALRNYIEEYAAPNVKIFWNRYWVEFITTGPAW